jgi:DnaJ-class molecular chaperone
VTQKFEPAPTDKYAQNKQQATQPAPGDVAPKGTEGTGEAICPECQGTGRVDQKTCENCQGSGKVVQGVGGG